MANYVLEQPVSKASYRFSGDTAILSGYISSMFETPIMILPVPFGIRGLLVAENGKVTFVDGGNKFVFENMMMKDNSILEVVLMDRKRSLNELISNILATELLAGEHSEDLAFMVTDVLAVQGVDMRKQGTEDRLNALQPGYSEGLRFYAVRSDMEDNRLVAEQIDSMLSMQGVSSVLVKGTTELYAGGYYLIQASVIINLEIIRADGTTDGRPRKYTDKDEPWSVLGIPAEVVSGQIVEARMIANGKAEYVGPSELPDADTKETIKRKAKRGGLGIEMAQDDYVTAYKKTISISL